MRLIERFTKCLESNLLMTAAENSSIVN